MGTTGMVASWGTTSSRPGVSGPGQGAEPAGGDRARRERGVRQVRADRFRGGERGGGYEAAVPGPEGGGYDTAEREGAEFLKALSAIPLLLPWQEGTVS